MVWNPSTFSGYRYSNKIFRRNFLSLKQAYSYNLTFMVAFFLHKRYFFYRKRSEVLLRSILPEEIIGELKGIDLTSHDKIVAKSYEEVTILFADMENFTEIASGMKLENIIELLNTIFKQVGWIMRKIQGREN